MESTLCLIRSNLFLVFGLYQATGHPMPGHLLDVPVRAVRLVLVFRTRSFHRAQRLLQHILLECLRNEQQSN